MTTVPVRSPLARAGAIAVDLVLVLAVAGLAQVLARSWVVTGIVAVEAIVVLVLGWRISGHTPGGRLVTLRRPATEQAPEPVRLDAYGRPTLGEGPTRPSHPVVVLDTGVRLVLDITHVLGRSPVASGPHERAVSIDDPSRSLSRTHLRVGHDVTGPWVQDAGSANGTRVALPNGEVVELTSGQRHPLPPGSVVTIGDRRLALDSAGSSPAAGGEPRHPDARS